MRGNHRRGEITAELDGKTYRLCLTLGALAELEAAYGAADLGELLGRLSGGRLTATDIVRIVGAGLRGAGNEISDDEVEAMHIPGGVAGFAHLVADLLSATFAGETQGSASNPRSPQPAQRRRSRGNG